MGSAALGETGIAGAHLLALRTHADDRGAFTELFRASWFPSVPPMVQANLSRSRAGVLRGMHYHRRQADLWVVIEGTAFVALADLRAGSPSRGEVWTASIDPAEGLRALYVPPGVAHGFAALTDMAMWYLVDAEFTGEDEFGFAWDDPEAGIPWPPGDPIVSERDAAAGRYAEALAGAPALPQP